MPVTFKRDRMFSVRGAPAPSGKRRVRVWHPDRSAGVTLLAFAVCVVRIFVPGGAMSAASLTVAALALVLPMYYPPVLYVFFLVGYVTPSLLPGADTTFPLSIAMAVAAVALIFGKARRAPRTHLAEPKALAFIVLLLAAILVSEVFAGERVVESDLFNRLTSIVACAALAMTISSEEDKAVAFGALGASGMILGVNSIFRASSLGLATLHFSDRAIGISDPNYLSLWIVLGVPAVTYLLRRPWRSERVALAAKVLGVFVLVVDLSAIVILNSRMGAILAAAALLIGQAGSLRNVGQWVGSGLLLACVAGAIWIGMGRQEAMESLVERMAAEDEFGGRVGIAQDSIGYLLGASAKDLLVGGGAQTNFLVLGRSSHNGFVDYQIDHGIVALLALIMILALGCRSAWREKGLLRATELAILVALVLGSLVLSPFLKFTAWGALAIVLPGRYGGRVGRRMERGPGASALQRGRRGDRCVGAWGGQPQLGPALSERDTGSLFVTHFKARGGRPR